MVVEGLEHPEERVRGFPMVFSYLFLLRCLESPPGQLSLDSLQVGTWYNVFNQVWFTLLRACNWVGLKRLLVQEG